mmetsp:Transcript_85765/g.260353  ORF Transcript_85765/g.260353 Transcript_85765/m.260353 type:complete len:88 (+) Transcript_85765:2650-2913(+)
MGPEMPPASAEAALQGGGGAVAGEGGAGDTPWPAAGTAEARDAPLVPSPAEVWRAEGQRRALEEMRRYRQEVRSREGGVPVRACAGY